MPIVLDRTRLIDRDTIAEDIQREFANARVKRGLFGNISVRMDIDSLILIKLSGSHARICGTQPLWYGLLNGSDPYGYQNDKKRAAERQFADWLKSRYNGAFV